jgi:hypothetical protein
MTISGSETKEVGKFNYLGIMQEKNGLISNEINESIRNASQFCHLVKNILWNKDGECETTLHKMYFKNILLYRAETWTCTKREESKIQAIEMKFLKAVMGNTKRARIRNSHIREELRM